MRWRLGLLLLMKTLEEHLEKILQKFPLSGEERTIAIEKIITMLDEEGFYTEQEYFGCGC